MADKPTSVRGVKIGQFEGRQALLVDPTLAFDNEAFSLGALAEKVRLEPRVVLEAVLTYSANTEFREQLFDGQVGTDPRPSPSKQRLALMKIAIEYADSTNKRTREPKVLHFKNWTVSPNTGTALVLPFSKGFAELLKQDAANKAQRERRMKSLKPLFDLMRIELGLIELHSKEFGDAMSSLDRALEPAMKEYRFIETLRQLMAIMGDNPPNGLFPSDSAAVNLGQLNDRLKKLAFAANKELLLESKDQVAVFARSRMRTKAESLRSTLDQAKSSLKLYRDNYDVAPEDLHELIPRVMIDAYTNLLHSHLAEAVLKDEIVPLIDQVAGKTVPPVSITGLDPDFARGLTQIPAGSAAETAATLFGGMSTAATLTVGNLPGPASFCIAVVALAQSQIQRRLALNPAQLREFTGKLMRFAFVTGNLTEQRYKETIAIVKTGQIADLKKLEWGKYLQTGPKMAGFLAILFFIGLCQNITDDAQGSATKMANAIAGIGGVVTGMAQSLGNLAKFSKVGPIQSLGFGNLGTSLGMIAGVAGIVVSGIAVKEALNSNDINGAVIAGASGIGALASVSGFAISTWVAADAAATAAALGASLQLIGVVIGVAVIAVVIGVALFTKGTEKMFDAMFKHITRDDGLVMKTADQNNGALKAAIVDLQLNKDDAEFWDIFTPDSTSKQTIQELADLGFDDEQIALLINESLLFVKARDPKR